MRLRFVRTRGEPDRVYVRRSDGSDVAWSFPTFGWEVPHDLVHAVVESMFGIRDGFWGRVDGGIDPKRVNEMANRTGGKNKYAGFGDDLRGLYLAEVLANLSWSMFELTSEDRMQLARDQAAKAGVELPDSVTAEALDRVQERLNELRLQWGAIDTKGTVEISFP